MGRLSSLESRYGAGNYKPLPVTLVRGEGIYVWDEDGRRYIDMMGAYSAASFGHCHPRLVAAMSEQARRLDTVSRAYFTDRLGPFLARACELTGMDQALPANGGAEAVETAVGRVPSVAALDLSGLDLTPAQLSILLDVDAGVWAEEAALIPDFYRQFGDRLPTALWDQHAALVARLDDAGAASMAAE